MKSEVQKFIVFVNKGKYNQYVHFHMYDNGIKEFRFTPIKMCATVFTNGSIQLDFFISTFRKIRKERREEYIIESMEANQTYNNTKFNELIR